LSQKRFGMKDAARIFREEGDVIDEALREGVHEALHRHNERGNPVVERDGKIVWLSAKELLDK
jgi:hypothetical protein